MEMRKYTLWCSPSRWQRGLTMQWVIWGSVALAFLLYMNTFDANFVYDDRRAILSNPDIVGSTPIKSLFQNDFWGTPLTDRGSHGSYRPLCVATYRLNYSLTGFRPWSYHFLNVLFHCSATLLVGVTANRLLPKYCRKIGSAVAALTFAAHPIHTEAVAAIVGRADLTACNLYLLSFLIYCEHHRLRECTEKPPARTKKPSTTRPAEIVKSQNNNVHFGFVQHLVSNIHMALKEGRINPLCLLQRQKGKINAKMERFRKRWKCNISVSGKSETVQWLALCGAVALAVGGTLCKEPAIMVLPLCLIYDLLKTPRKDFWNKKQVTSVCALTSTGAVLLYWRLHLGETPTFAAADNPASRDPITLTRFLTFAYLPVFNFYLLIFPFYLSFDWSMEAVPKITELLDHRNLFTVVFYTTLSLVTCQAVYVEFIRNKAWLDECKELEYKQRQFQSKQPTKHRIVYNETKRDDLYRRHYAPQRNHSHRKQICTSCKCPTNNEHTANCRLANNNNYLHRHSICGCDKIQNKQRVRDLPSKQTNSRALLLFLAFMTLPFLPASNMWFYVGFVVAERVLYLPSVGFCLLLGLGAGALTRGGRRQDRRSTVLMWGLIVTLVAMCGRTLRRNYDWRNEESLFRSAIHINPPKAYGNLGSVLTAQGRYEEAVTAFQRALAHRHNMAEVHYNLGILLQSQKRYDEAIKSFDTALSFRPSMALAYINKGASLVESGRMADAAVVFQSCALADGTHVRNRAQHNSGVVSCLVQLAAIHAYRGMWEKALSAYQEAMKLIPVQETGYNGWTKHDVFKMMSEMYQELKDWAMAESSLRSAVTEQPNNPATVAAYAKLLARNSHRAQDAEEWFKRALQLDPNNPSTREQYASFRQSHKRMDKSAEDYVGGRCKSSGKTSNFHHSERAESRGS